MNSNNLALPHTDDSSCDNNYELIYLDFLPCRCSMEAENSHMVPSREQDSTSTLTNNWDTSCMRINVYSKTDMEHKRRKRIHPKIFRMNTYEFAYLLSQMEKSYSPPISSCQDQKKAYTFKVALYEPTKHYIDHKSNDIVTMFMVERRELEHSLNWLSTLGGAFSALGENCDSFAHRAGKVSKGQLLIAMKLGSPLTMSRCRLYAAISLLQLGNLKSAREILRREWEYAKSVKESDPRLQRMCIGIWAKLKYEWHRKPKKQIK